MDRKRLKSVDESASYCAALAPLSSIVLTLDSQVIIPAIRGLVPDQIVQCVSALLDFCYLARRSAHDMPTLVKMDQALARFHELRKIFIEAGVRPDGFSLP